jgi:Circularly permutated YpsA SLOG family
MIEKIISGGQTGVDRAALDVALALGIPCGGWCPKGRRAEDGKIPGHYPLQEASSSEYPVRTQLNVEDSDGTLILSWGSPAGGTALTIKLARRLKKPYLLIDLSQGADPQKVREWVKDNRVEVLNVAGPREGEAPGIHDRALSFLRQFLRITPGDFKAK